MIKKLWFGTFVICFLFFFTKCTHLNYDVMPHQNAYYHSMRIKINVKNKISKEKQSFKILLKYTDHEDKMFFLSPLNQLYGKLFVKDEKTLLINTKKKRYWQGRFRDLLYEFWRLDFDYKEFKHLLLFGKVPRKKIRKQNIRIILGEDTSDSGGSYPQKMEILTPELQLKLKISHHKTSKGILSFSRNIEGMQKAYSIKNLLESEND